MLLFMEQSSHFVYSDINRDMIVHRLTFPCSIRIAEQQQNRLCEHTIVTNSLSCMCSDLCVVDNRNCIYNNKDALLLSVSHNNNINWSRIYHSRVDIIEEFLIIVLSVSLKLLGTFSYLGLFFESNFWAVGSDCSCKFKYHSSAATTGSGCLFED